MADNLMLHATFDSWQDFYVKFTENQKGFEFSVDVSKKKNTKTGEIAPPELVYIEVSYKCTCKLSSKLGERVCQFHANCKKNCKAEVKLRAISVRAADGNMKKILSITSVDLTHSHDKFQENHTIKPRPVLKIPKELSKDIPVEHVAEIISKVCEERKFGLSLPCSSGSVVDAIRAIEDTSIPIMKNVSQEKVSLPALTNCSATEDTSNPTTKVSEEKESLPALSNFEVDDLKPGTTLLESLSGDSVNNVEMAMTTFPNESLEVEKKVVIKSVHKLMSRFSESVLQFSSQLPLETLQIMEKKFMAFVNDHENEFMIMMSEMNLKNRISDTNVPNEHVHRESKNADTHHILLESDEKIDELSIPVKTVSVGRPKGAVLNSFGLPKPKSTLAFDTLNSFEKQKLLLTWLNFPHELIMNLLDGEYTIKSEDLKHLEEKNIKDTFMSDDIDISLIKHHFAKNAFSRLRSLIQRKKQTGVYTCGICCLEAEDGTIQCDRCYVWIHFECSGLDHENRSQLKKIDSWFCADCL